MKKILLIILCITMLIVLTACSDKKEDSLKNNGDTLQEEKIGSKLSLEFVNEYPERLSLDHSTKEIYYNDDWYYVIIGKNGELYDEVQKKEVSSDYSPLSSNNYNVKIKKNKIGVYYKNKLVVNYSIKYLASGLEKNENKAEISENMIDVVNDALILRNTSYYWDHNYNDIKWSEAKTYLITSEGIKKHIMDIYQNFMMKKIVNSFLILKMM